LAQAQISAGALIPFAEVPKQVAEEEEEEEEEEGEGT
jgi:hypothetical protein